MTAGTEYPDEINALRATWFTANRYQGTEADYYALGGAVFGPLFSGFCVWAAELAGREKIYTLLPLMRDGELLSRLLRVTSDGSGRELSIHPVYVSRLSSRLAQCYGEFDFDFFYSLCRQYPCTVSSCFEQLGIQELCDLYEGREQELNQAIIDGERDALRPVYEAIIRRGADKAINCRIAGQKGLLGEYLRQNGATGNFITMDYGGLGTLPQAIDNCTQQFQKRIHLFLNPGLTVEERIAQGHDIRFPIRKYNIFSGFQDHFLETVTMGNMNIGSATGYQKNSDGVVRPICSAGNFPEPMRRAVSIMQDGIADFCADYVKLRQTGATTYTPEEMIESGILSVRRFSLSFPLLKKRRVLAGLLMMRV